MAEEDSKKQEILDTFKNIKVERLNGVNYQRWLSPNPPRVMYDLMKKTKIRASDVITMGYPRSGNHWTYDVMYMILNQTTKSTDVAFVDAYWEFRDEARYLELDAAPSPRNLTTHSRPRRLPEDVVNLGCKIIIVLRNPKDVIKSMYEVCGKFEDPDMVYTGTWAQFFELYLMGEFTWGSWFDHTLEVEKFINDHPELPIYIHQYEKAIEDPVGAYQRLSKFLGYPEDLAEDIAKETAFEHMKAHSAKVSAVDEIFFGQNKSASLMGSGAIGGWRKWFTVAQSERFNEIFDTVMKGSKLGALVREYIEFDKERMG